jgi:exonuclease VII small subunit
MARKPTIQYKIRIREDLRRRIEKAAEKNGVSANYEMVNRLERSFDQEAAQSINQSVQSINQAAVNLDAASTRYTQASAELKKLSNVVRAAQTIITLLPGANTPLPLVEAAKKLERAMEQTEQQEAAAYRKLTTSGDDR